MQSYRKAVKKYSKKGIDFAPFGLKRFTLCTLAWVPFLEDVNS